MRATLAALVVVLVTAPAQAEEPIPKAHKLALVAHAITAGLDMHSTYTALQRPWVQEDNPLWRWAEDRPGVLVTAASAANVAATVWLYRTWGKRHPRLTTAILIGASVAQGLTAYRNYQHAREDAWKRK